MFRLFLFTIFLLLKVRQREKQNLQCNAGANIDPNTEPICNTF